MYIERIQAQNVRNLTDVTIEPSSRLNIFTGPNASGKTAFLEAIYFLSRVRSFRTPRVSEVIQYEKTLLRVTASICKVQAVKIKTGIEKQHGKTRIQYNGNKVSKVSEQAKNLPVILIAPDTNFLVTGTPQQRRHWLDWAMFHVEPSYLEDWRDYYKALRQRNTLLKNGLKESVIITAWEQTMSQIAAMISGKRELFLKELQLTTKNISEELLASKVTINYKPGWPKKQDLGSCLKTNRETDKKMGYTQYGAHRADVEFLSEEHRFASTSSRGQVKLFVAILLIAQAKVIEAITGEKPMYLIDDYTAELDVSVRAKLISLLLQQETQVFLTTTEPVSKLTAIKKAKMFHVERGKLTEMVE